jgi:6-phospho-beta-glucosidase
VGCGVPLFDSSPLASELLGLVQHVAAYERLAASAAATGDLDAARRALMTHPLVREYRLAETMLNRLLAADRGRALTWVGGSW